MKVEVRKSLCLSSIPWRCREGNGVKLQAFLTWILDRNWGFSRFTPREREAGKWTPGTVASRLVKDTLVTMGGWMGPRVSLNLVMTENIWPLRGIELRSSSPSAIPHQRVCINISQNVLSAVSYPCDETPNQNKAAGTEQAVLHPV
jgi:hypothetical protein